MSISRPFRRNVRQFTDGTYSHSGKSQYILHPKFAVDPDRYVRAFLLIQRDILDIFDFIEPAEKNTSTYSFRLHSLLMRICIEIEANFKAILTENEYPKRPDKLNMTDYAKCDRSHRLSSYQVKVPYWRGAGEVRTPFAAWSDNKRIPWYQAYNSAKHDRHTNFSLATFSNVLDAVCGLVALLASQFWKEDFSPAGETRVTVGRDDVFTSGIGDYYRVSFPSDWPDGDKYDFTYEEWQRLSSEDDPFQNISF